MLILRALIVALLLLSSASCSSSRGSADEQQTDAAGAAVASPAPLDEFSDSTESALAGPAAATLAPGALVELVPSLAELPAGFSITPDSAGPVDLVAAADRSDDPEVAERDLKSEGFRIGYAADYGSEQTGAFVSVFVLQFESAAGAHAAFTRQAKAASDVAKPLQLAKVGDESAAFVEMVSEGDVAEIESIHFRVRDLVWIVETGGDDGSPGAGSPGSGALEIANKLVRRIA